MTSSKHKALFVFIVLQIIGAFVLIASFYIRLWPLELIVSFTQLFIVLLFLSLLFSSSLLVILKGYKSNWPLLVAAGTAWILSLYILSYALTTQNPVKMSTPSRSTVTFASLNKLYSNRDDDRYIDYFKQQNVDILVLQEIRSDEVVYVAEQLGFEYHVSSRTFATSGMTSVAVISRYPFESTSTIDLATEHPIMRAVVQTPESGNVAVYSVHIPVPSSNFLYNKRNVVLESLADTLGKEDLPVVVGGDFNTTPFSPALRTFTSQVNPTLKPIATKRWPDCSWYGFGPVPCIRIDHIFASDNIRIADFTIAPDLGSDHRALVTRIQIKP